MGFASGLSAIGPHPDRAGTQSWDIGLHERFAIKEHHYVQFRGEFFNAFNTVNLSNPGTTLGTATFGSITGAGSARTVELGLKIRFLKWKKFSN